MLRTPRSSRGCAAWPGRGRRPPARRRAGGCALRRVRRHDVRGPSPPARRRRAADSLRLRAVHRDALGRGRPAPDRDAHAAPRRLRPARRALGPVPDPDRAGLLLPQRGGGRRRRAVPEPGRRHGVRAVPRRVERAGRRQPGAARSRARGRGARRQPARRPAPACDRPDRPLLRAGRDDQGDAGRGSPAGDAVANAVEAFFAPDPGRQDAPLERRRRRAARSHRSSRCTTSPGSATPPRRRCRSRWASRRPRATRSSPSRSRRRSTSTPRAASTTPRRARSWSSSSGRPSGGRPRPRASCGPTSPRWCRVSRARRRSRCPSRAATTSSSRRRSTSTRCPTARSL